MAVEQIAQNSAATDSRGKVTTNTYDTLNRLQTSTDPLSRKTTYTYDAGDHVVSITNPMGEQTQYIYDGCLLQQAGCVSRSNGGRLQRLL